MELEIVEEILVKLREVVLATFPDLKRLEYEHDLDKNNERGLTDRYGIVPGSASFVGGSVRGSTTIDHVFTLILTTDYINKDDDRAQSVAVNLLYSRGHAIVKEIQKKAITLPTSDFRVTLISGLSFDSPEHTNENSVTTLKVDFNIQYRFRNN